jgi:NAD(P)-dependent dehydrogenase (short-subunit alcohol dehydrogenase family)
MQLAQKNILITGGARVGQFVAQELQQAQARVIMTYFKDPAEAAPGTDAYQLDITQENSITTLTATLKSEVGPIHALINMASVFAPDPAQITQADITKTFAVNAFGSMLLSRWFAQEAKALGSTGAPIISFIDWAIDHPYKDYDVYLASKAALRHYLMGLQTTYAGIIRVVNIHPGMILEPPEFPAGQRESIIANTPLKTIGTPEQAAHLVRTALELDFLADNIHLAGGQQWRHRL